MIIANAATPLAGVVDTGVIAAASPAAALGGVALGGVVYTILYATFYVLRMSTSGLTAQAEGAGDADASARTLARALSVGLLVGFVLLAAAPLAAQAGFALLNGPAAVEAEGRAYFLARAWGFPGALAMLAITGWLIGRGEMGATLAVSLIFSIVNIVLDLVFVLGLGWGLGWGVAGVGAATAIGETAGALVGAVLVRRSLARGPALTPGALSYTRVLDLAAARRLFAVNSDLVVRTWSLIAGFSWFAHVGAQRGEAVVAGNHVLLQIVALWAFVLDAFAFVAESEVGRAIGARDRRAFGRAVQITGEASLACGLAFAVATLVLGPPVLAALVADAEAAAHIRKFLPYCAAVPLLGALAWHLDGVFIGATRSRAMRNAALGALAAYLASHAVLAPWLDVHGMWLALLVFYVARAFALSLAYPSLARSVSA